MRYFRSSFTMAALGACLLAAPAVRAANDAPPPAPQKSQTAGAAGGSAGTASATSGSSGSSNSTPSSATIATVVVTAKRLNRARSSIETQTGASSYQISSAAIAAEPGGANVQLNQVLLQAPDVVKDSFGQIHVRGNHDGIQYRLNGIILPEGISVFGQTLDPRLISNVNLLTGALPAEYGLNTAGVIDLTTKNGLLEPGGYVSIYGGSQQTIEPAFAYGGSSGNVSYYVSGDVLHNNLGLNRPSPNASALHDLSTQGHGFGYVDDILDSHDRIAFIAGISDDEFQIPDQYGLQPALGLDVNGVTQYSSNALNERQHELTQYGIFSWQHSAGALNWQSSISGRYTSLHFQPDLTGDLLYNGIAQNALLSDTAFAWQTDASYRLSAAHTLRAGFYLQHDSSLTDTASRVLPIDALGSQTSNTPLTLFYNSSQAQEIESAYVQDEWKILTPLTVNYGLRFDHYNAYSSASAVSPRLNVVWKPFRGTTFHAGYSRYFTPPPFQLVASQTFTQFAGTTALPPGSVTRDTTPVAEFTDYYDVGLQQTLLHHRLTLGVDSYYQTAQNLLDEGQFGAPIVLTPFNYRFGHVGGVEFTGNYTYGRFTAYGNLAFQTAHGKDVVTSQFNFTQQQLAYIAENYIALDHEQRVTASGGLSYLWHGTQFSTDALFGTGLREDLSLPSGVLIPNGTHTPSYTTVNLGVSHAFLIDNGGPLTVRFDVINLLDKIYLLRSGTGIGVFLPQYGAPRGFFGGLSWDF